MEEGKKKTTYTEAQKKATQKYRDNNKEKVNLQRKQYYNKRKNADPNFMGYKRLKAKEYYQKRKQLKETKEDFLVAKPIEIIEHPNLYKD